MPSELFERHNQVDGDFSQASPGSGGQPLPCSLTQSCLIALLSDTGAVMSHFRGARAVLYRCRIGQLSLVREPDIHYFVDQLLGVVPQPTRLLTNSVSGGLLDPTGLDTSAVT
ncbi:hypothetical protein B0G80_4889 [Paraburkholderia sp. BL6669N2]|nr:hypothetical protein B0G80_4889 [Paraburkholderia sp. BL6669N2]